MDRTIVTRTVVIAADFIATTTVIVGGVGVMSKMKLALNETRRVRHLLNKGVSVNYSEGNRVLSEPFNRQYEYELTAMVRSVFWSSEKGSPIFNEQRDLAERALIDTLYADILGLINPLRNEIMSGSQVEALQLCSKMEKVLRG